MRPPRFEQDPIVRIAIDSRPQKNELPGTVIFRHGIGATFVDAARYFAVPELVRSIPTQIVGSHVRVAKPQERFRDHRTVADPRTPVRPRAGAEDGTVACDEQMRKCRPQGVDKWLSLSRNAQRDAIELFAPHGDDGLLLSRDPFLCRLSAEIRWL